MDGGPGPVWRRVGGATEKGCIARTSDESIYQVKNKNMVNKSWPLSPSVRGYTVFRCIKTFIFRAAWDARLTHKRNVIF